MSNLGLSMQESSESGGKSGGKPPKQRRKREKRSAGGRNRTAMVVAMVVILGIVAVVGYGGYMVYQKIQASAPAPDYSGPGEGTVVIQVQEGQTLTDIGVTLKKADVVASTQAFAEAAAKDDKATSITPGSYVMLKEMAAVDAVARLLNPESRNENTVVIPEGSRTSTIEKQLIDATGLPKADFDAALAKVELPSWARGTGAARTEGFLYPATYDFQKDMTANQMIRAMVDKFTEVTKGMNFEAKSKALGYSPYQVLTVASLITAEANSKDYGKVSRVIYNALDPKTWGGTYGYIGIDATILYGKSLQGVDTSKVTNIPQSWLDQNSPYNTRTNKHHGLPPTPINNPGEKGLQAALDPTPGDWLYYATVNLDTGETKFTSNYKDFLRYQQELRDWEANNPQKN